MQNIATHEDEFFILLQRVGTKGRYQRYIFFLSFGLWSITSFILLSVAFLLLPNKFTCPQYPDEQQCKKYVCSLPQKQWHDYQTSPIINSIITELGDYHCQYEFWISTYKIILFAGVFLGYIIFMHFSDNMGRRFGMILTWSTVVVGLVIVSLSQNMLMVCLGLLLTGAGCESNLRIDLSIMNQMVDNHLRQKYSLILQCAFGTSGILVSLGYYFLRDWRTVNTFFCTIPAIILLIIMIFYLQDTPNHLLRKGSGVVLKSLQRIAAINGFQCLVTEDDIVKIIQLKKERTKAHVRLTGKRHFSIADLVRFKSLKMNTFHLCAIFFFLFSLYIGPNSAINQFKVNIFILQVLLSVSDCLAYPIACYFIHDLRRKKTGIKCFILIGLFNLIAFFLVNQEDCDTCISHVLKLALMFCSRFCVSYYYGVLFVYVIELYPEQIRTIGFGIVSAVGSLGAIAIQYVIQFTATHHQDPLIYFAAFALICIYFCSKLPQTHGLPLQVQIQELKIPKVKKSYEPAVQQQHFEEDDLSRSSTDLNITHKKRNSVDKLDTKSDEIDIE